MNRKLAVPLALDGIWEKNRNVMSRSRILKDSDVDHQDLRMLMKIADNRVRLEKLMHDLEDETEIIDTEELRDELDYINATIQLGLLEITGELEEVQTSEDLVEEAFA